MVLYNLRLVLISEPIQIYDRVTERVVYEGLSKHIPKWLLSKLVHDMTIVHRKDTNTCYLLINID